MKDMIYINGEFKPGNEARIDPGILGVLRGIGVFETLRVHKGKLMWVKDHLKRLRIGADTLGLKFPLSVESMIREALEIVRLNALAEARVRITLLKGRDDEDKCTFTIHSIPMSVADMEGSKSPVSLMCAGKVISSGNPYRRIKITSRVDYEAFRETAISQGKFDALLLNERGEVTECTRASIFAVKDGKVMTSPVNCGLLPGLTRARVLEISERMGFNTMEEPVMLETLLDAEAVFITTTPYGIRLVESIDDKTISMGESPEFSTIYDAFQTLVEEELAEKATS